MPIALVCPGCQAALDVPESLAGRTIRCTTCQSQLTVPRVDTLRDDPPRSRRLAEDDRPAARRPLGDSFVRRKPIRIEEVEDDDRAPRRPRPRSRKANSGGTGLLIGGAVLGLLLLGGVGYGLYAVLGGSKSATGDGGAAAEAKGWVLLDNPVFSLRMPSPPAEVPDVWGKRYELRNQEGNGEYFAMYASRNNFAPQGRLDAKAPPETILDLLSRSVETTVFRGSLRGKAVNRDFTRDGFPAREVTIQAENARGMAVAWFLVTDANVVILAVSADNLRAGDSRSRLFFDSFALKPKPQAAPVNPPGGKDNFPPRPPSRPPSQPGPPPGQVMTLPVRPGEPDNWQPVADAEGFEAEMPRRAVRSFGRRGSGKGLWQAAPGPDIFAVMAGTMLTSKSPADALAERAADYVKGRSIDRDAPGPGMETTTIEDANLGPIPGKQINFTSNGSNRAGVVRMLLEGTRMYTVVVAGPDLTAANERAKRFLDSFKILAFTPTGGNTMPSFPRPGFPPVMPRPSFPSTPPSTPPSRQADTLTMLARVDSHWAAVFAPEKNEVLTIGLRVTGAGAKARPAGMLRRYSYPDFKLRGSYELPNLASKAVLDETRGLLYVAALTKPEALIRQGLGFDRTYGDGVVQVFDVNPLFAGELQEREALKPLAPITNPGRPVALELSADGKTLYSLNELEFRGARGGFQAKLLEIDTTSRTVKREMALPEPTRDMIASADRSRLYLTEWPVGPNNVPIPGKSVSVAVVDPAAWTRLPSIPLPGFTTDLAAAPGGGLAACVAMNGGLKLFTLDAAGGPGQELPESDRGSAANGYLHFTPDGQKLVVSSAWGRSGVDVYAVSGRGQDTKLRRLASARPSEELPLSGAFRLSPDGRFALFRSGAVVDLHTVKE